MSAPLVAVIGIGEVGDSLVSYSVCNSLRQMHYTSIGISGTPVTHSDVVHFIDASEAAIRDNFLESDVGISDFDQQVIRILWDVDTVVIIFGADEERAGLYATRIAQISAELQCLTIAITIFPFQAQGRAAKDRASKALTSVRRYSDYLLPFPMDRVLQMSGGVLGPSESFELLHAHLDDFIDLVAACPSGSEPLRARRARKLSCALVTHRRFPDPQVLARETPYDPKLDPFFLVNLASGESFNLLYSIEHSQKLDYIEAITKAVEAILPNGNGVRLSGFPKLAPGSLLFVSISRIPKRLTALLEISADTPTAAAANQYRSLWQPRTKADLLDLGKYDPTKPFGVGGKQAFVSEMAESPFAAGTLLDRLDKLATRIEDLAGAIFNKLRGSRSLAVPSKVPNSNLGFGRVNKLRGQPLVSNIRRIDWPVIAVAMAVFFTPVSFHYLTEAVVRSASHAVMLDRLGKDFSSIEAMQEADKTAFAAASSVLGITKVEYEELGLSASSVPAQVAHLDLHAVDQRYFSIVDFNGSGAPFDYVQGNQVQADGQISRIIQSISNQSDSPITALYALGISVTPTRFAELTGKSTESAADEIFQIYQPTTSSNSQTSDWQIGCGSVHATLKLLFYLKRFSQAAIQIPERYYIAYLSLISDTTCAARQRALAATKISLAELSDVKIIRTALPRGNGGAAYSVVIRQNLFEKLAAQRQVSNATPLELYRQGMQFFYLLDFRAASERFTVLSNVKDPIAASLGHYLKVRSMFWYDRLTRGDYRPDIWPPTSYLQSSNYDEMDEGGEEENGPDGDFPEYIPDPCRTKNPAKFCLLSVRRQTGDRSQTAFDESSITAEREALSRMPIIDLTSLGLEQGKHKIRLEAE